MDCLLSHERAWACVTTFDNSDTDDGVCLTECGEGFLQMLLAMTDGYKTLPQPLFANYPSFCFSPAAEGLSRTDVGDKRRMQGSLMYTVSASSFMASLGCFLLLPLFFTLCVRV